MIEPIDAAALKARLDAGEDLVLLDVREARELAVCQIEGVVHIPLGELTARWHELDPERPTVCICHHGMRSAQAAQFLLGQDFDQLFNLTGGVDAWAQRVDPSMARY